MKSEVSPRVQKVWSYLVNDGSAVIREISSILSPRLITAHTAGSISLTISLSLTPVSFLHIGYVCTIPDFRERYRYERAPSRTLVMNGAKTLRQIKKYGRGPMYRALARNYIRDFFPSIRRSSAMRHRLAELFPRKILAIFTRTFFSREMAHVLNHDWLTVLPPFRYFPFFYALRKPIPLRSY